MTTSDQDTLRQARAERGRATVMHMAEYVARQIAAGGHYDWGMLNGQVLARGGGSLYIAVRLAKEHPAVFAACRRGEYLSWNAAARDAGIPSGKHRPHVGPRTPVEDIADLVMEWHGPDGVRRLGGACHRLAPRPPVTAAAHIKPSGPAAASPAEVTPARGGLTHKEMDDTNSTVQERVNAYREEREAKAAAKRATEAEAARARRERMAENVARFQRQAEERAARELEEEGRERRRAILDSLEAELAVARADVDHEAARVQSARDVVESHRERGREELAAVREKEYAPRTQDLAKAKERLVQAEKQLDEARRLLTHN